MSIFSQFIAFITWYHGRAMGEVAQVGQIQLLQQFLTVLASAILLGETHRVDRPSHGIFGCC
ncbi:hypothetical protein [Microcoleus sp. Pol12B4]|uniref:hypothetical protein n=1 Tax=Microcoleus sp. Pol12B4 TaxID=3055395 RepID=UPI002FD35714